MPVGDSRIRPNNVETQLKDSQVEIVLKNYDLVVETILSMRDVVHGQEPDRQPFHAPGKAIVRSYIKQYYLDEWSNILQFRLMNLPAEAHNHIYKKTLRTDHPRLNTALFMRVPEANQCQSTPTVKASST